MSQQSTTPCCYQVSEDAVTLQAPAPVALHFQQQIWALAEMLKAKGFYQAIVPGMNNLTVQFEPSQFSAEMVQEHLLSGWHSVQAEHFQSRELEIPVRYGGDNGPDLRDVATHTGLSEAEVIRLHSESVYTVFFLGFQPGFAYLGGLPESLHTPRRATPRAAVPAGAVAIGGAQTGVYPKAAPGGWQIIGHTDVVLFDPRRDEPCFWRPGDQVRFIPC